MRTSEFDAEGIPAMDWHLGGGETGVSRNTSSRFIFKETGDTQRPDRPLG